MPTGPEGEKRPAGVIGNAVTVIRIATGEEREDHGVAPAKNKTAQELGRAGGRKCAESMTPERRAGDREEGGGEKVEKLGMAAVGAHGQVHRDDHSRGSDVRVNRPAFSRHLR